MKLYEYSKLKMSLCISKCKAAEEDGDKEHVEKGETKWWVSGTTGGRRK